MLIILLLSCLTAAWLLVNTRWVKYSYHDVSGNVPDGFSFIHISDIHGSVWFLNGRLSRLINRCHPDFVVLTGDLTSHQGQLSGVIRELSRIHAAVYMVPGNYETEEFRFFRKQPRNADALWEQLGTVPDLVVLKNEHCLIQCGRSRVLLYGFDNSTYGKEAYRKNLSEVNCDHHLVLAHSPNILSHVEKHGIQCHQILTGHTHGGQIRLPGNWLSNAYGHFHSGARIQDGKLFSISRGLGTARIPLRFRCYPEISVYRVIPAGKAPEVT